MRPCLISNSTPDQVKITGEGTGDKGNVMTTVACDAVGPQFSAGPAAFCQLAINHDYAH
jgi:hypothetical protein